MAASVAKFLRKSLSAGGWKVETESVVRESVAGAVVVGG